MTRVCWGAAAKYTAEPALNRNWVGRIIVCIVEAQHYSLASIEWMLASTGDGG